MPEKNESGNQDAAEDAGKDAPEGNRLEKIMKERFGDPQFGNIMNRIVDEMFKSVDKLPDPEKDPGKAGPAAP